MKKYYLIMLASLTLFPFVLKGQNIVFSYEVETISSSESIVKVFARENNGSTENLSSFTVYFYYDNTESALSAFDYSPLTTLGWTVNQSQILHDPITNAGVPIIHTGYGFTNVSDDNGAGTSIGALPVHILTLSFDHSTGSGAASEGFLASMNEQPALVYTDNNFNEFPVVVTGQQSQALPVELLFFRAFAVDEMAQLEWATAGELNADYFEIQHSMDGKAFEKIGQVQAAGFSTAERHYEFLHKKPASGINYYRLKQFDLDGSFEYSNVASVYFTGTGDWQSQVQVYPNPASDFIFFKMPELDDCTVELMDVQGRIVLTKKDALQMDVSALPAGVYFLKITEVIGNEVFVTLVSVVR